MSQAWKKLLIASLLALSAAPGIAAAAEPTPPAERVFEFQIEGGKVAKDKARIRVIQGENLRLRWTADEPIVLHLHGYDIERRVEPGAPAEMAFAAHASGKFPVYAHRAAAPAKSGHGHGAPLVSLEIYPR